MDKPLLSINIVSFQTKDITLQCLRSIDKSVTLRWVTPSPSTDIEIVIVDNNSKDGSREAIATYVSPVGIPIRVIHNRENIGFGKGHNVAARASRGEYLLLLNTDTILVKDALATLLTDFLTLNPPHAPYPSLPSFVQKGYKVHFAGPKLLNADFSPQPSCGPYYSIPTIIGALFLRGDHWGLTRYSPHTPQQVDWVSGASLICKQSDFLELGGFDENIFMYMEEVELLYRARKKGMNVWCLPSAHVIHLGSASSNKTYPIYQVYRGFLYLYRTHHSALSYRMVQWLLVLKARIAIILAHVLGRKDIAQTYQQACAIAHDTYQ